MSDLEPKLGPGLYSSLLYYEKPITFTNAYQYMLDAIKVFDKAQELKQIQDIQDNIIQEYFE